MFSVPRLNVIESDEGFSVEVLGRTAISNREGDKVLFVDSEALAPGKGIASFTDSIQAWNLPPDPARKRGVDHRNIKAAIEFQKQPVEIL
jgi:hypothetical protein